MKTDPEGNWVTSGLRKPSVARKTKYQLHQKQDVRYRWICFALISTVLRAQDRNICAKEKYYRNTEHKSVRSVRFDSDAVDA